MSQPVSEGDETEKTPQEKASEKKGMAGSVGMSKCERECVSVGESVSGSEKKYKN